MVALKPCLLMTSGAFLSALFVSKLFEMAILDRFSEFFETSDHEYGFKKHLSCRDAIYTVRQVTERYISNGSTVNMCTLDLSEAFDRTNHYALLINLMHRNLRVQLLTILELWFRVSVTCVSWNGHFSAFYSLTAGVRRGVVLSPFLYAVFLTVSWIKSRAQMSVTIYPQPVVAFFSTLTIFY